MLALEGDPGAGMFVLCEGTIAVELRSGTLELGPGDFFGELALLVDDGARVARVRATIAGPLRLDPARGVPHAGRDGAELRAAHAARARAPPRRGPRGGLSPGAPPGRGYDPRRVRDEDHRREPPCAARLPPPRAARGRPPADRDRGEGAPRRRRADRARHTRRSARARRGSSARRSPSTRAGNSQPPSRA